MQFDRGYLSPYFVTNSEKMESDLESPYILLYDKNFRNERFITSIEPVAQTGKPLLVIAEEMLMEKLLLLL